MKQKNETTKKRATASNKSIPPVNIAQARRCCVQTKKLIARCKRLAVLRGEDTAGYLESEKEIEGMIRDLDIKIAAGEVTL
jgi:hypothetical protein